LRLYRKFPGSKLFLTGGNPEGGESKEAEMMREMAIELGVINSDIVIEKKSMCTAEQVLEIKNIIGGQDFILITSATHMPRAVSMFDKQGMKPHPMPTDFILKESEGEFLGIPLPSSHGLWITERGFYELWAKIGAALQGET